MIGKVLPHFGLYWVALVSCGCISTEPSPQQLVEQLGGRQCVSSYEVLDQRQDLPSATAVAQGLHHPNPRVRSQCLRLLGSKQDTQWIGQMLPLLNDSEAAVYQQAARSLIRLMDTAEIVQLLDAGGVAASATAFLIALELKDPLELLCPELQAWLLKPQPYSTQMLIFQTLGESWTPRLDHQYSRTPDLRAQLELAHRRLAQHAVHFALRPELPEELRSSAVTLYGCFGGLASFSQLRGWAQDPHLPSPIRRAALVGLGLSQHPRAAPILAALAYDEASSLDLRMAAARGLAKMDDNRQARQALLSLLHSRQEQLRWRALAGLGNIGDKECLAAIRRACDSETSPQLQAKAQEMLNRLEMRGKCARPD